MLDNCQLAVLPQSGGTEFEPHWVHDNLMVPLWVYIRFPVQSININSPNMYITRARAKCKSKTHRYWNWRMCIQNGWSVVQGRIGHVIGIVFFIQFLWHYTNALDDWQMAVLPQYGGIEFDPRWVYDNSSDLLCVCMRFRCTRASQLNQQCRTSPKTERSSKLSHTDVEIDTCAFQTFCRSPLSPRPYHWDCVFDTFSVAWNECAGQLAAGDDTSVLWFWVRYQLGLR